MRVLFLVLVLVLVSSCGKKSYDHGTVETARAAARDNSRTLASAWKIENAEYAQWNIRPRGDSTINSKCPQGDGWASIDLIKPKTNDRLKLKCSTYSQGTGCLPATEFKTKKYAMQEGKCNSEVPHPLPKIEG
jgi:hypothetical protein